jgi:glycerate dehydrogenase
MMSVILDGYTLNPGDNPWTPLEGLGEVRVYDRSTPAEVRERAAEADILLTNKTPLPQDIIQSARRLKFISVLATGYNIVDIDAARQHGIIVSNVPDYGTNTVAQFVMGLLLELCHRIGDHSYAVRAGAWTTSKDWTFWNAPQIELYGKPWASLALAAWAGASPLWQRASACTSSTTPSHLGPTHSSTAHFSSSS